MSAILLVACLTCTDGSAASASPDYGEVARRIIAFAEKDHGAYEKLEHLCDDIGHRISGSPQLDRAIAWAVETMKRDGHENVHTEKVMVPRWVRGRESATMLEPRQHPITMLGLGLSIGTPRDGITAEVEVAADEKEFDALGDRVKGRIVLFNNPMPPYDPVKGSGYGETVRFRGKGATMVAGKGGVACLVRSVTAHSLRSAHTGAMRYDDKIRKIPAAAISVEDAEMISRLRRRGIKVVVNLRMEAHMEANVPSANVIAELRGREKPDEVVVMGGHIDSWDVGQGAHDDGAGITMSMHALTILRKLDLRPRRTIRVVLWTNEENGLAGGRAYASEHKSELSKHVAAIEADSGGFRPEGFGISMRDKKREEAVVQELSSALRAMSPMTSLTAKSGGGGADIGPLRDAGVPLLGLDVEGSKYFDYHHTQADTLDKVSPTELEQCAAAMAFMAYVIADMPERLGGDAIPRSSQ